VGLARQLLGRKEGEASRQIVKLGWAVSCGLARGERGRGKKVSWAGAALAGGLVAHEGY
jgi:hypothetical protein